MIVVMLAAIAAVVIVLGSRNRGGDLPQRLVLAAANRLSANRSAWGQALIAEMAAIADRGQRWRFAAAAVRIAAFPPTARPASARATAAIATLLTVLATVATIRLLPTLAVFTAALGLLISGYATIVAGRSPRVPSSRAQLIASAVGVIGVLAAVGSVVDAAVTHPSATDDRTHLYSIALATALAGYLVAGVSATVTSRAGRGTEWVASTCASAAVAASSALLPAEGVIAPVSPIIAAATLATALATGAATRSRTSAMRAGLLTAVLSTPLHFAIAVMVALHTPATLTNSYDIAAYPQSGFPDVASYLLSDTLGGNIVSLVVTPLAMWALTMAGAAAARNR
jgi:hypothetical protein